MSVRRGVTTLVFVGLLFLPALTRAQDFSTKPTAYVSGGYAVQELIPNNPTKDPDVRNVPFFSVGGGYRFLYGTPRTDQALGVNAVLSLPLKTSSSTPSSSAFQQPLYNGKFDYTFHVVLSELSELTLGLAGSA